MYQFSLPKVTGNGKFQRSFVDFEQAKYFLLKKMNLLSNIEKIKKVVDSATQMSALLKTGLRFSRNKS